MSCRWTIGLFTCLLPLAAAGQVICVLGPNASSYDRNADQRPSPDALELAARLDAGVKIICGTNCPAIALLRNATAANAMLIVSAGQGKLVYAPRFFSAAYDRYGDGGILALLAHEIGHALDDTLGAAWVKSSWPPELRADAWAGCALARVHPAAADLAGGLGALAQYPAPAHPAWNVRLPVLRSGFTQCGGDGRQFDSAAGRK